MLYDYYMDMKLNVKEIFGGKYFAEKWQHLQIVALEAEDTVLLSADVEGPTLICVLIFRQLAC